MQNKVLLIVGPTAAGKTKLSLKLAEKMKRVEIVSADSRQVYKLMDIGTAKPTLDELEKVPHHFIDIIFPDQHYSAGKFGREARQTINQLRDQGKFPIVVGGSGLYVRALVDGFFEKQLSDPIIKKQLKQAIKEKGVEPFYEKLAQIDPRSAAKIHPNDAHRIVRALEVYQISGLPISELQKQQSVKANFIPVFVGLNKNRDQLYSIIEKRVEAMLSSGLIEEVESLLKTGHDSQLNSMQTVGYREVIEYLNGNLSYDEMVDLIKKRTRNYAKRQLTWFRKDKRIKWYNLDRFDSFDDLADEVLDFIKTEFPHRFSV